MQTTARSGPRSCCCPSRRAGARAGRGGAGRAHGLECCSVSGAARAWAYSELRPGVRLDQPSGSQFPTPQPGLSKDPNRPVLCVRSKKFFEVLVISSWSVLAATG